MARKSKEDTEKTRESLLLAALKIFSDKGYTRTSLKDIADEAGVTRGAVYWHFRDKAHLFEALSDHIKTKVHPEFQDLSQDIFHSLEDLASKLVSWMSHLEEDEQYRTFQEFLMFKVEYHDELLPVLERNRIFKSRILERLEKDFSRMQQRGEVRPDMPCSSMALMVSAFSWGLLERWLDGRSFSIREICPQLVQILLDGFRPRPT